jgi:hypothetical protein
MIFPVQIKSLCVAREMVKSMAVEAQAYRQDITSTFLPSHWSAFSASPSNGRRVIFGGQGGWKILGKSTEVCVAEHWNHKIIQRKNGK